MSYTKFTSYIRGLALILLLSWGAGAPCQITGGGVTIVDGAITLNGTIEGLASIQAISGGNYLSLDSIDVGPTTFNLTEPFGNAIVVVNSPTSIVMGVLGLDKRINVEGTTRTSILYSQPHSVAAAGDLAVDIGLFGGETSPCVVELPVGGSLNDTICKSGTATGGGGNNGGGNNGGGNDGGGNNGGGNNDGGGDSWFELDNGEVFLIGDFEELDSIQVTSPQGLLSLGDVATGIASRAPFPSGSVAANTPNNAVIGTLGGVISVEGETMTSILFSESLNVAKGSNGLDGDLTVNLGLAGTAPAAWPIGTTAFGRSVTIIDGTITLVGSFEGLAGIEAISEGGFLSLETAFAPGTLLFPFFESTVTTNEADEIVIAARNTNHRASFDGRTATGIFYSGDADELAFDDLAVMVGLGDAASVAVPFLGIPIPEPSSVLLGYLGLLGLLCVRNRRTP